jgi:mRNA interferase MazF
VARDLAIKDVVSATFPQLRPGGHEQQGYRPAVVVGLPDVLGSPRYQLVFLAPFTRDHGQAWTTINPKLYPRFPAGTANLPEDSICLLDQARTLDARRLGGHRGTLTAAQYRPIETGLARIFGFPLPVPATPPASSPAPPRPGATAGGTP